MAQGKKGTGRKSSNRKSSPSGININPANKGKLRKSAGTKSGNKVPIATLQRMKKSKNPKTRKRATFALNVRQGKIGGKS